MAIRVPARLPIPGGIYRRQTAKGHIRWPFQVDVTFVVSALLGRRGTGCILRPLCQVDVDRCTWWAPTPRAVVSVFCAVSAGGATLSSLP